MAFGFRSGSADLGLRLALAVVLSPIVLTAQFYGLRLVGISFANTTVVLTLLNLVALRWVLPAVRAAERPEAASIRGTAMAVVAAVTLPVSYVLVWMGDTQFRANFGHSWSHASLAYLFANGQLRPEEPLLAGVRIAYPWLADVPQALYSFVLNSPPSVSYIWSNGLLTGAIFIVAWVCVRFLGGGRRAQVAGLVLLSFGVNAGGYLYARFLPQSLVERYPVYGDFRFSPWVRKFGIFEPTAIGIAICAGIIAIAASPWRGSTRRVAIPALGVGLVGLAVLYPILLPTGCAAAGSRLLVSVVLAWREQPRSWPKLEGVGIVTCLVAALVVGVVFLEVVTVDRVTGAGLGPSDSWSIKIKAVGAVLALPIPGLALLIVGPKLLRTHALPTAVLALTGMGCVVLWTFLDVYNITNEYKYMFPAAIALSPFAAILAERVMDRLGKAQYFAFAVGTVLLALPAFAPMVTSRSDRPPGPELVTTDFGLALGRSEPLGAVTDAVRRQAPMDAIIISREAGLDLVALTGRALYVPYDPGFLHGVGYQADLLLKNSRGYAPAVIDRRRQALHAFYGGPSGAARAAALAQMNELNRPLVVIVDRARDGALVRWLEEAADVRPLDIDGSYGAFTTAFDVEATEG